VSNRDLEILLRAGADAVNRIGRSAAQLRERAAQYRRVASRLQDADAQRRLLVVADEFEADAAALEAEARTAAGSGG